MRARSITYSLGMKNETFEWLNVSLLVAEGVLKLLSDHVDLLSYPKSRAGWCRSYPNAMHVERSY